MGLLTARTLGYIVKVIKLGQRLGCHPYSWNAMEKRAEVTKSKIQYFAWILTVVGSILYYIFLVMQWYRASLGVGGKFNAFMSFALIFSSFLIFFQLNMIVSQQELPAFLNAYLSYNQGFQERYIYDQAAPKKLAKILEFVVVYVYSAFWLDYADFVAIFFIRPHGREQISSLVTTEMWDLRRLALYVLFLVYGAGYVVNACLMIFTSFGFFFSAFQILQEFGLVRKKSSVCTFRDLQEPQNLLGVFKVLGLLVGRVDRTYRVITAMSKLILILLAIFCTYGGMRLHGFLVVTLGTIGTSTTIFLAVIMTAWSGINSISKKALRVLVGGSGNHSDGRYNNVVLIRRQVRTLHPLVISVFDVYVIDKPLVLTVMKVTCEQIIFLLVNY